MGVWANRAPRAPYIESGMGSANTECVKINKREWWVGERKYQAGHSNRGARLISLSRARANAGVLCPTDERCAMGNANSLTNPLERNAQRQKADWQVSSSLYRNLNASSALHLPRCGTVLRSSAPKQATGTESHNGNV